MKYWLSNEIMTVAVETDSSGKIISSPPATGKFMGQNIDNLKRWMGKYPGFKWEIIQYGSNRTK